MLFLVELDHVKSGTMLTADAGRAFIEQVIFPTLARAEQLVAEKKILAGGPVVGRIAIRFILEADSLPDVDRIVSSLPVWPLAGQPESLWGQRQAWPLEPQPWQPQPPAARRPW